jgi:hypothetical protein
VSKFVGNQTLIGSWGHDFVDNLPIFCQDNMYKETKTFMGM